VGRFPEGGANFASEQSAGRDLTDSQHLTLARHGAERFQSALSTSEVATVKHVLGELPPRRAGIRIHGNARLRDYLMPSGPIGACAASVCGADARPVRAVLFDKTFATNWALGWHQDATIAVRGRVDVEGFGCWTIKHGLLHVAPPAELLARMVTLRVHLDPVTAENAPLLIAPGSHRFGRIAEPDVPRIVQQCGTLACLADATDVWIYATPIVHASAASRLPARRRVLQVDYAAEDLPDGLSWLGI
jgi:hypothetical protein